MAHILTTNEACEILCDVSHKHDTAVEHNPYILVKNNQPYWFVAMMMMMMMMMMMPIIIKNLSYVETF
jgi:hypothetical protein